MSDITNFIREELYPLLFNRVDTAFPEMHFQRYRGGWASPLKLDGTPSHDGRKEKSVITPRVIGRAKEQGGQSIDLIDLYRQINGVEFIEAVKQLCSIVGLELPPMEGAEAYKAYKEKQDNLERVALQMSKDIFSEDAKEVYTYLREERGYSDEFIKYAGFGYVSDKSKTELRDLLKYTNKDGAEVFPSYDIGEVYRLAIPYRSGNSIKGFVFRSHLNKEQLKQMKKPKYKDAFISATASKKYHLYGLTGLKLTGNGEKDRDIVIVEGEIDAMRASFSGIENVVAASGGEVLKEALQEAKRRGVKRATLLFDTEDTAESQKENYNKVKKAITTIQAEGLSTFVCYLPSDGGKSDVDSFLKNHTAADLKAVIDGAVTGSLFLFQRLTADAIERQGGEGEECSFKNLHEFKSQTIALCNSLNTPATDRDVIFREFAAVTGDYITKESLQEEADALKLAEDKNRQKAEAISLSAEALKLANSGETDKAISLMLEKAPDLQRISKETEYSSLLITPTAEGIKSKFRERPIGVKTGFSFAGKEEAQLILPTGALTYICAPTSHGKSRMLENLALQLATNREGGDVLYFSFEEDSTAIQQQLLNIYANMQLSANNLRSLNSYYIKGNGYFRRDVNVQEFQRKEAAFFSLLSSGKLRIYDTDFDSSELIGAIRYLNRQRKLKAVFIDYIQLIHKKGTRLQRKDELKEICKDFMALAKEIQLPIVLAAQLNRETYSPIEMAVQNIAEASDIEHSANVVMLLWNSAVKPLPKSGYYSKKGTENQLSEDASKVEAMGFHIGTEGKLYAILEKNRGGERGIKAVLDFNGNTGYITPNYNEPSPEQTELPFSAPSDEGDPF
jgi:DNA primase